MQKVSYLKRVTSILLAVLVVLSCAVVFGGCKEEKKNVPEDLEVYSYDNSGNPTGYYKNEYDENNNCVKNANYNSEGELLAHQVTEPKCKMTGRIED